MESARGSLQGEGERTVGTALEVQGAWGGEDTFAVSMAGKKGVCVCEQELSRSRIQDPDLSDPKSPSSCPWAVGKREPQTRLRAFSSAVLKLWKASI